MLIDLHPLTSAALNSQYKTYNFTINMTIHQLVECAESAMQDNIQAIDYQLNGSVLYSYGIVTKKCEEQPFTKQEGQQIKELVHLVQNLIDAFGGSGAAINNKLEMLKDYVVKHALTVKVSERYHKYLLFFKKISIKQAIIFQTLRRCQIFYTIMRQRKKSGKEFFLDPLINCFQTIKNKLDISHPFHEKVLPRKQLRVVQKKNTVKKMKNTLFDAVSNRKYSQVKQLISKGANLEEPGINERQNNRQMNCVHRACQLGDLQMCRILHSYKVNWEAPQKQGQRPFHYAVQSGNINLVKYLVQQIKVDLEPGDINNRTPFYFVCTDGDMNTIQYLYQKGCNINNQSSLGRSALSKACYLGLVQVVTFLMQCPGIVLQTSDTKGRTALHNSVFGPKGGRQGHKFGTNQKDSPECTQLLLQNGFNVDIPDKEMNTPLHVAMSSDGRDSIRVLLAFGASLSKLNCYGETPLMTGAKFGHIQAVKMLRQEYRDDLTIKDIFNKNMMLLCAKFKQDFQKSVNEVFYYSTDELLSMASHKHPLSQDKNYITNWQEQIDHTFAQLLKESERVVDELAYFCNKCRENQLQISQISLADIKLLFQLVKNQSDGQFVEITQYVLFQRAEENRVKVELQELEEFVQWILLENSVKILQFVSKVEPQLKQLFIIQHQQQPLEFSFSHCLSTTFFTLLPQLKQKVLTYCLLKLNINWIQPQHDHPFNIVHLLIRSKKVGSLIQVLKILSGVKMDFITNQYILRLTHEQQNFKGDKKQSPLRTHLKHLLTQKDKEGFDAYNLALLVKDASSSKLIEQKLNQLVDGFYKSQFDVKQYSVVVEDDQVEQDKFAKGYNLEQELELLIAAVEKCSSVAELATFFSIFRQNVDEKELIHTFQVQWKNCSSRKICEISHISQIQILYQLQKQSVLGMDIEYFYCQGATLISIMQISSPSKDYIVDFLTSAHSHQANRQFTQAVSKSLRKVAEDPKIMKIMHGSDNDLCVIRSVLHLSFLNFLDTARVDVQLRKQQNIRGLSTLVKEYLHEHMSKDYQVSEWRIRPIPSSMLDYARRDSMVLPFLASIILRQIPLKQLKEMLLAGSRHARKNKKSSQPLIKSIQAH